MPFLMLSLSLRYGIILLWLKVTVIVILMIDRCIMRLQVMAMLLYFYTETAAAVKNLKKTSMTSKQTIAV